MCVAIKRRKFLFSRRADRQYRFLDFPYRWWTGEFHRCAHLWDATSTFPPIFPSWRRFFFFSIRFESLGTYTQSFLRLLNKTIYYNIKKMINVWLFAKKGILFKKSFATWFSLCSRSGSQVPRLGQSICRNTHNLRGIVAATFCRRRFCLPQIHV